MIHLFFHLLGIESQYPEKPSFILGGRGYNLMALGSMNIHHTFCNCFKCIFCKFHVSITLTSLSLTSSDLAYGIYSMKMLITELKHISQFFLYEDLPE